MTNNSPPLPPGAAAFRAGVGPRVVRHCKPWANNEVVDVLGLAVSICDGAGMLGEGRGTIPTRTRLAIPAERPSV